MEETEALGTLPVLLLDRRPLWRDLLEPRNADGMRREYLRRRVRILHKQGFRYAPEPQSEDLPRATMGEGPDSPSWHSHWQILYAPW